MPTRSNEFRYVYANAYGVRVAGGDAFLTFGIDEDPARPGEAVLEEVSIALTLQGFKILVTALNQTLENVEKVAGPIPLPEGKSEEISKAVADGAIAVVTPTA